MGNDKPMITTREFWFATRLAFNLVSIVDSPISGKQVFTGEGPLDLGARAELLPDPDRLQGC
jgi:hypothetical protein